MENLQEQIHLRNIISCLKEIGDYTHYLSYERYLIDEELKKIVFNNLRLAADEATSLYQRGVQIEGLKYLASFSDKDAFNQESYALFNLLQNDLDYLTEKMSTACNALQDQAHYSSNTITSVA